MELKFISRRYRGLSTCVLIAFLSLPLHTYGQKLHIGAIQVRFGAMVAGQVTNVFTQETNTATRTTNRVSVGPTVEVGLGRHLSIEVDALYRSRLNYTTGPYAAGFSNSGTYVGETDVVAHTWEIPVLAQWHGSQRFKNLFFGGGVSFREASGRQHVVYTVTPNFPPRTPHIFTEFESSIDDRPHAWTYGATITAGIDIHKSIFHIRPQVRYIRWNAQPTNLHTKADAVQVLMGVSFGK